MQPPNSSLEAENARRLSSYRTSANISYKITDTWLSQKPNQFAFLITSLVTLFVVILSVVYWENIFNASSWMPASGKQVFTEGSWWQAWTALFAHSDGKHLLSNSFLFFILGSFLAGYFGYLMFPLLAFIFGGITNFIVLSNMPPDVRLLGASGVVFWLGGAWLALYFLIDQKHSIYQRILRTMGVALVLFFPAEAFDPNVSYSSHFTGFALGIVVGVGFYYLNKKKFDDAIVRVAVIEEEELPFDAQNLN